MGKKFIPGKQSIISVAKNNFFGPLEDDPGFIIRKYHIQKSHSLGVDLPVVILNRPTKEAVVKDLTHDDRKASWNE